jgi:hypothetical protein
MTDLVFMLVGCFFFAWLAIVHVTVSSHRHDLVDQGLRIRTLQDHLNRIQREVRGK